MESLNNRFHCHMPIAIAYGRHRANGLSPAEAAKRMNMPLADVLRIRQQELEREASYSDEQSEENCDSPTPEQIAEACAEIQAGWSDADRDLRRYTNRGRFLNVRAIPEGLTIQQYHVPTPHGATAGSHLLRPAGSA